MSELGYVEGENLLIEWRFAERSANADSYGFFTLSQARPGTWYRIAVQRCEKVLIGKDDCTGWTVRYYQTSFG